MALASDPGTTNEVSVGVDFNHTLVHAKGTGAAARDVVGVLGLGAPSSYGPSRYSSSTTAGSLDCIEDTGETKAQHYAFVVGEDDFDAISVRHKAAGRQWWATRTSGGQGRSATRTAPRLVLAGPERPRLEIITPLRQRELALLTRTWCGPCQCGRKSTMASARSAGFSSAM
jgi:hypothetical protein